MLLAIWVNTPFDDRGFHCFEARCEVLLVLCELGLRVCVMLVYTGRGSAFARKFVCKPFDVSCELCEHLH